MAVREAHQCDGSSVWTLVYFEKKKKSGGGFHLKKIQLSIPMCQNQLEYCGGLGFNVQHKSGRLHNDYTSNDSELCSLSSRDNGRDDS